MDFFPRSCCILSIMKISIWCEHAHYHGCPYFKIIVIPLPDAPGISDCVRIETIQEGCQTALHHYVKEQGSNNLNRFNKLLLRLPSVRAVDGSVLEKVLFSSLVGNVSIKELITDMLTSDPDCNEMSEQRLRMRAR